MLLQGWPLSGLPRTVSARKERLNVPQPMGEEWLALGCPLLSSGSHWSPGTSVWCGLFCWCCQGPVDLPWLTEARLSALSRLRPGPEPRGRHGLCGGIDLPSPPCPQLSHYLTAEGDLGTLFTTFSQFLSPSLHLSTPCCHFYSAPRVPRGKQGINPLCLGFLFHLSVVLLSFLLRPLFNLKVEEGRWKQFQCLTFPLFSRPLSSL